MKLSEWLNELKDSQSSPLVQRYTPEETCLRAPAYRVLLEAASSNVFTAGQPFDAALPVQVVASPGRDRVFMGHSDFAGLGGFTVDAATQSELLAVGQLCPGGKVQLYNTDPLYEPCEFELEELLKTGEDPEAFGKCIWSPVHWSSYLKGALCYLLSSRWAGHVQLREALGIIPRGKRERDGVQKQTCPMGLKFLVSSQGKYALPAVGGVSSSAALTGALTLGLTALLGLQLPKDQLAQSDYGEYFLGKLAGAADKMAQLNAERGKVVVVGSRPERCIRTLDFPKAVVVMLADCPTPRLTTKKGEEWLTAHFPQNKAAIQTWAQSIMKRFSSAALALAAQLLADALRVIRDTNVAGEVSPSEASLLLECLYADEASRTYKGPLLRELCRGGALNLEQEARYDVLRRALRLVPQEHRAADGYLYTPRKVALYGLSEVERGMCYLDQLETIANTDTTEPASTDPRERLLQFVRWSHDGDRACEDYRSLGEDGNFAPTTWSQKSCDWPEGADLIECVGGFERSLPEMDEMADELDAVFDKKAAGRVAAAGLGGQMCVHAFAEVADAVAAHLTARGWTVRRLHPGSPTQVLKPPSTAK